MPSLISGLRLKLKAIELIVYVHYDYTYSELEHISGLPADTLNSYARGDEFPSMEQALHLNKVLGPMRRKQRTELRKMRCQLIKHMAKQALHDPMSLDRLRRDWEAEHQEIDRCYWELIGKIERATINA